MLFLWYLLHSKVFGILIKRTSDSITVPTFYSANEFVVNPLAIEHNGDEYQSHRLNLKVESACTESFKYYRDDSYLNAVIGESSLHFLQSFPVMIYAIGKFIPQRIDAKSELKHHGTMCVSSTYVKFTFFRGTINTRQRSISFWFQAMDPEAYENPSILTGEIRIGNPDTTRFSRITTSRYSLEPISALGWVTKEEIPLHINQDEPLVSHSIFQFDIGTQLSLFPEDMFDAIVGDLKPILFHPLDGTGLPSDIYSYINEFTGETRSRNYFNCHNASLLHSFSIGNVLILPEWLYQPVERDSDDCMLHISPISRNTKVLPRISFNIIKRTYLTINTKTEISPFLEISERVLPAIFQCVIC